MTGQIRFLGKVVLVLGLLASVFGGQGAAADGEAVMGPRDYGADLASMSQESPITLPKKAGHFAGLDHGRRKTELTADYQFR